MTMSLIHRESFQYFDNVPWGKDSISGVLTGNIFADKKIISENFSKKILIDSELKNSSWSNGLWDSITFSFSGISDVQLQRMYIDKCAFRTTKFKKLSIRFAHIVGTEFVHKILFDNAKFYDVYFSNCIFDLTSFKDCNFEKCVFDKCVFTETDFSTSSFGNLGRNIFTNSSFKSTTFKKCNFRSVYTWVQHPNTSNICTEFKGCKFDDLQKTKVIEGNTAGVDVKDLIRQGVIVVPEQGGPVVDYTSFWERQALPQIPKREVVKNKEKAYFYSSLKKRTDE